VINGAFKFETGSTGAGEGAGEFETGDLGRVEVAGRAKFEPFGVAGIAYAFAPNLPVTGEGNKEGVAEVVAVEEVVEEEGVATATNEEELVKFVAVVVADGFFEIVEGFLKGEELTGEIFEGETGSEEELLLLLLLLLPLLL
jgi:hypothetical protein